MTALIHNAIPLPNFLNSIGGNITGTITINRRFEEHPTASVQIIASTEEIGTVRNNLRENFTTKFIFYGIPFRLRNYNEKEHTNKVYPKGYYLVSLDFEGFWKKLITDPLLLREKAFTSQDLDDWQAAECRFDTQPEALVSDEIAHPYKKDVLITYLSKLAERAGVPYDGDGLFTEFPIDASYFTSTTLNQEINDLLPTLQKVVKYSKESGIVTQEWDVATDHELGEEEVIKDINFSINSEKVEYINTELNWNKFARETAALEFDLLQLEEDEDSLNNNRPVFEADIPEVYEIVTGAEEDDLTDPPLNDLTDINLAWDLSGPTKTQTVTTYEGSTIIQVRERIYGFAFNGIDIYSGSGSSATLFGPAIFYWMPVRDLTTVYTYDEDTGYLIGDRTTGFIRNRFLQDRDISGQEKNEDTGDLTYTIQIRNNSNVSAVMEMYRFNKMPYTSETKYLLKQFGDYYQDGRNLRDQYILYDYCGTDGKVHTGYVIDPTYVEPMFISAVDTLVSSVSQVKNADYAEDNTLSQVIVKGEESYYSEEIEIFQSEFTKSNNNLLVALQKLLHKEHCLEIILLTKE